MKIQKNAPPRVFQVGANEDIIISDCGKIYLESNEQVTFVTAAGKEHDVVRKSWGYYATSSVNGRLVDQGFKTALVKNQFDKYYIMLVEIGCVSGFEAYLSAEKSEVVEWLDER